MPDAGYQIESVAYGFTTLRTLCSGKRFGCVGGAQFVHYERGNRNARVAPDVFVSLGAAEAARLAAERRMAELEARLQALPRRA